MSIFYKPAKYNGHTKQQMWMSVIADFHDPMCNCWHPFGHLLDIIFPEGHKDRDKTIAQIITRDSKCHSGGEDEGASGQTEDLHIKEERDTPADTTGGMAEEETTDALLAAAVENFERCPRISRTHTKKEKESGSTTHTPTRKRSRNTQLSPLALQRRYLPKATDRRGDQPAHPAAAAAAAPAQKRHPTPHDADKRTTTTTTTTHRHNSLTKFKPGFEQDTEEELAKIFKRPIRTFKEDPPFYPWLPITPKVSFKLNFKG
ncbi:hypothetical protein [Torque teno midi virus 12]|uniref:Hepatitis TT virus Orf2/Gyrovirus Vp2 N-terminal domain-containing protein n=2 Tax=Torque teno midi virus 12 TaxID=2065053 RepID=A7VLZ3_9VIRU|nr:hypothetical protein [Torque teno midi virus 12]BAF76114.1 hypothetical protein [Torque teno midi virus 12]